MARFSALRHDDAYITFQIARNLASGAGFAFNAGDPVFGSTTPLFTLLLAVVYAGLGEVLPQAAVALGAAGVGAQAWLLHRLLAPGFPATAWLAAVAALLGGLGHFAFLALETHLFLALLLAALWTLVEERPIACGAFLGLAFLCRYDAALLIPLVALWQLRRQRRSPVRTLAAAAVPVLPWLVFAWLHLGALLPQTLAAKFGVSGPAEYLTSYAALLLRVPGLPAAWPARVAALAALGAGLALAARGAPALLLFAAFAALHLSVYASIGPSVHQHWHMAPALLAARLLVLLGCFGALELQARRSSPSGTRIAPRRLWQAAPLLLAGVWCVELGRGLWSQSERVESAYWLGGRHARYATVASWVDRNVEAQGTFMAHEIGTLGYLTRRRMIDPFGLINETNEWPRTKEAADFVALVRHYAPDVILVDTPQQGRLLERHEGYRVVKVFDWDDHWSTLVVRSPRVLRDPSRLEALRADPRTALALATE